MCNIVFCTLLVHEKTSGSVVVGYGVPAILPLGRGDEEVRLGEKKTIVAMASSVWCRYDGCMRMEMRWLG